MSFGTPISFITLLQSRKIGPDSRPSLLYGQVDEGVDDDWRNFRAKLVMQERNDNRDQDDLNTSTSTTSSESTAGISTSNSWAYETDGQTIEKGSIILSRPLPEDDDSNVEAGLFQQYFHKSIILVLEHNDGLFTKGIILNRPSNLLLSDDDFVNADGTPLEESSSYNQWKAWFGGEVNGIADEEPEIICLHSLPDKPEDEESEVIMKDIKITSLEGARSLVKDGHAKATDFLTFIGYCGWDRSQLSDEISNNNWYIVAADSKTLLNELKKNDVNVNDDILNTGIESWSVLMKMIGRGDEIVQIEDSFDDLMLKEWTKERLIFPSDEEEGDKLDGFIQKATSSRDFGTEVGVGTMLRSSSFASSYNPFLLSDQEYHQSTLLIIQDDEEMSVGVILNLPSASAIALEFEDTKTGGESSHVIPMRYGGRYSDASDDDSLLWFHCNDDLKRKKVGSRLGPDGSFIWTVTPEDAANAIATGVARAEDFIAVSGLSVWEKAIGGLAGGIKGEVNNNLFEVVDKESVECVWDILLQQEVMTKKTAAENLSLIDTAWCEGAPEDSMQPSLDAPVNRLAFRALQKWISAFLIDR